MKENKKVLITGVAGFIGSFAAADERFHLGSVVVSPCLWIFSVGGQRMQLDVSPQFVLRFGLETSCACLHARVVSTRIRKRHLSLPWLDAP